MVVYFRVGTSTTVNFRFGTAHEGRFQVRNHYGYIKFRLDMVSASVYLRFGAAVTGYFRIGIYYRFGGGQAPVAVILDSAMVRRGLLRDRLSAPASVLVRRRGSSVWTAARWFRTVGRGLALL